MHFNLYIFFLKPNGRFEVNKKICLSISGHHPETWQPSWSSMFYFTFQTILNMKFRSTTLFSCILGWSEKKNQNISNQNGLLVTETAF